jgi:uncharacterized membrane-anchored protein
MTKPRPKTRLLTALLLSLLPAAAHAQTEDQQQALAHQIATLNWIAGPNTIEIANVAGFDIPQNYELLTPPDSLKFLQLNGNNPAPDDATDDILQNTDPNSAWFAIIAYQAAGHIDDSQPIDPVRLLATMRQASDLDDANRRAQGIPTMTLTGWAIQPGYDSQIHRLEWAYDFTNPDNSQTVNLNGLILGRTGFLKITVVDDPAALNRDIPEINAALDNITFNDGQRYQDSQPTDPKSPYTLATLIGAAPPPPPSPAPTTPQPNHHLPALLKALLALAILATAATLTLRAVTMRR